MSTTIYVVRHGQSEGNINGDIFGSDPPLTQKGIEQAELLAKVLDSVTIDIIFSSHLKRAHKTARIIAGKKKIVVNPVKELRERFFGSLEGKKGAYILENHREKHEGFLKVAIDEQMKWKLVDDMESFGEVLERLIPFLNKISKVHDNKTILLVIHANVMLSLLVHLKFATFNELPYGSITNTGYLKIEKDDAGFKITELFGITKN